jgi:hypothetical protein
LTKGEDILFGELFGRPKVLPVRFFAEISEEPREVVGQVSPDCGTEPFAKQFLGNHRHFQLVQLGVHDGHDEAFESRISHFIIMLFLSGGCHPPVILRKILNVGYNPTLIDKGSLF